MLPVKPKPVSHGDVLTAVSDGMIGLFREFYGRGPSRASPTASEISSSMCEIFILASSDLVGDGGLPSHEKQLNE